MSLCHLDRGRQTVRDSPPRLFGPYSRVRRLLHHILCKVLLCHNWRKSWGHFKRFLPGCINVCDCNWCSRFCFMDVQGRVVVNVRSFESKIREQIKTD